MAEFMKVQNVERLRDLVKEAKPLDEDCQSVLVSHILSAKLGDGYIFDDIENIVEKNGAPLYTIDEFEPRALLHQKSGVLFLTGPVNVWAFDWKSKASSIPDEFAELVEENTHLSSAEISEQFIRDVLPNIDDLDDPDLADEIRTRLYM